MLIGLCRSRSDCEYRMIFAQTETDSMPIDRPLAIQFLGGCFYSLTHGNQGSPSDRKSPSAGTKPQPDPPQLPTIKGYERHPKPRRTLRPPAPPESSTPLRQAARQRASATKAAHSSPPASPQRPPDSKFQPASGPSPRLELQGAWRVSSHEPMLFRALNPAIRLNSHLFDLQAPVKFPSWPT